MNRWQLTWTGRWGGGKGVSQTQHKTDGCLAGTLDAWLCVSADHHMVFMMIFAQDRVLGPELAKTPEAIEAVVQGR